MLVPMVVSQLERLLLAGRLRPHPASLGFSVAQRFAGVVLVGFVFDLADRAAAGDLLCPAEHGLWLEGVCRAAGLQPDVAPQVWEWCCELATAMAAERVGCDGSGVSDPWAFDDECGLSPFDEPGFF